MNILGEIEKFYKTYQGKKGYIGSSEKGRLIPYFEVGNGARPVIIAQYGIHAREYITCYLALEHAKYYYGNFNGTLYIIPAVNPDGISIVLGGNKQYKANANGVDLNVNFDARWGTGASNLRHKANANYIGEYPFSQSETRALRDFTLMIKPDITVSYHSKGEEIYYEFFQPEKDLTRDKAIATAVSKVTGYAVKSTPNSAGGYKDWCIEKLKIPALTIEVGNDTLSHPIKKRHLRKIFEQNKEVFTAITKEYKKWIQK